MVIPELGKPTIFIVFMGNTYGLYAPLESKWVSLL